MYVTPLGISIEASDVALRNAFAPIDVIVLGKVTDVRSVVS